MANLYGTSPSAGSSKTSVMIFVRLADPPFAVVARRRRRLVAPAVRGPDATHSRTVSRSSADRPRPLTNSPWPGAAYQGGIRSSVTTSAIVFALLHADS